MELCFEICIVDSLHNFLLAVNYLEQLVKININRSLENGYFNEKCRIGQGTALML